MATPKPYWVFVAGMVLLLVFVLFAVAESGPWFGPGGRRRHWPWLGPGGTRRAWLGPGGTRQLLGYNAEGFLDSGAKFTMIGVDWCPHCVAAKPEFEKLSAKGTTCGKPVTYESVNHEKHPEKVSHLEVKGYPTFYLEKQGQKIKYSGARTAQAMDAWLCENL